MQEVYSSFLLFKVQNEGRFFPKQPLVQFKIHNFACTDDFFTSKGFGSCFLVTSATAVIFVYHQKMANIWQIRGAPYGAQWRVPTNFILYVFTLMLVLMSYYYVFFTPQVLEQKVFDRTK